MEKGMTITLSTSTRTQRPLVSFTTKWPTLCCQKGDQENPSQCSYPHCLETMKTTKHFFWDCAYIRHTWKLFHPPWHYKEQNEIMWPQVVSGLDVSLMSEMTEHRHKYKLFYVDAPWHCVGWNGIDKSSTEFTQESSGHRQQIKLAWTSTLILTAQSADFRLTRNRDGRTKSAI